MLHARLGTRGRELQQTLGVWHAFAGLRWWHQPGACRSVVSLAAAGTCLSGLDQLLHDVV